MGTSSRVALLRLLEPMVRDAGMDLEDVRVSPAGRRRLLRVVVDKDGGVTLEDIAALSTTISARLDDTDVMGGAAYVLEVTSPGVDRSLTEPRHWRRAHGRLVTVELADGGRADGRVGEVDDAGVLLHGDDGERRLQFADVAHARVEVEFRGAERDGERSGAGEE